MSGIVELVSRPWPWYVAGPLVGLVVPALLLLGGKSFGVSGSFRDLCAAAIPTRLDFFRYDWRRSGGWNLLFALGLLIGGLVAGTVLASPDPAIAISEATRADLIQLGVTDLEGLVPDDLIGWRALATLPGFVFVVLGGLLVGFGSRYAGGCTSGHAITGLASFELPSLLAVLGFFAGGLISVHLVIPLLL